MLAPDPDEHFGWVQNNIETFSVHKPVSEIEQLMMVFGEPEENTTDWELVDLVAETLQTVEQPHQLLLRMVFFDRYTYNEITEMMGYSSKSHTWYHVQKGLRMLKEKLSTHPTIIERLGLETEERKEHDDND